MATNYGLLSNMAGGIREAMIQYQTMKNQNRQNDLYNLAHGIQEGENGLELTPLEKQKREVESRMQADKLAGLDAQVRGRDVNSDESKRATGLLRSLTGQKDLPDMSKEEAEKAYGLVGSVYKADAAGQRANVRGDALDDWRDRQTHKDVIKRASSDKLLVDRLKQAQNLDNAVAAFQSGTATPQQFEELQQAVRSNMGMKGSGGVHEREATYLKSLGQKGAAALQFITSQPQDINNFIDPSMVKHVLDLVNTEKANILNQADQRLKAVVAGQGNLYGRRPDLKMDLNDAIQANLTQFNQSTAPSEMKAPEKKSSGGLLSKVFGGGKEKIRVSNGKETLMIDPSDLSAAEKDGYKAVK